jgi:hypothetical protein
MSNFSDSLHKFSKKTRTQTEEIMQGLAEEGFRSIVMGSELTGAPGQPVDKGFLRASWQMVWEDGKKACNIITNCVYARDIEDGERNGKSLTLRSQVGGFHSVKLTVSAFHNIVTFVTNRVKRGA